jgi:hypothetical protein
VAPSIFESPAWTPAAGFPSPLINRTRPFRASGFPTGFIADSRTRVRSCTTRRLCDPQSRQGEGGTGVDACSAGAAGADPEREEDKHSESRKERFALPGIHSGRPIVQGPGASISAAARRTRAWDGSGRQWVAGGPRMPARSLGSRACSFSTWVRLWEYPGPRPSGLAPGTRFSKLDSSPIDASVYTSPDPSRHRAQDSRPGWFATRCLWVLSSPTARRFIPTLALAYARGSVTVVVLATSYRAREGEEPVAAPICHTFDGSDCI